MSIASVAKRKLFSPIVWYQRFSYPCSFCLINCYFVEWSLHRNHFFLFSFAYLNRLYKWKKINYIFLFKKYSLLIYKCIQLINKINRLLCVCYIRCSVIVITCEFLSLIRTHTPRHTRDPRTSILGNVWDAFINWHVPIWS